MFNKKYEKEYCMVCGNENPQDQKTCACGGREFVFGNNFSFNNKKVTCKCGNDKFNMIFHLNRNPIYDYTYQCSNCKNTIGMQSYYEGYY